MSTLALVLARGDHDRGPGGLKPLLLLLIVGLLTAAIVAIVRKRRGPAPTPPPFAPPAMSTAPTAMSTAPTAIAVLQERFARGEIEVDEFERRRDVLEGRAAPAQPMPPAADEPGPETKTGDA